MLGFDATNDIFAEHAWYFRNALVRANYTDLKNGVHETTEYLELFLKNLLLDEKNELHNRTMHVSGKFNNSQKVDIEDIKVDIEKVKKEIELKLLRGEVQLKNKTITYILTLYETYGQNQIFGRTQVENVIGVKSAMASRLIKLLLDNDIIEPVSGHGKGKYRFL